jgi:hypothetical protein
MAAEAGGRDGGACTRTAKAAGQSCLYQAQADFWLDIGLCRNKPAAQHDDCVDRAESRRIRAARLCAEQFDAREDVCDALGERRYRPEIDPESFVAKIDNPYMPLKPGTTFVYRGETEDGVERITVTVTDETETILGVKCTVVRDVARLDGEVIEDTLDWFAQDKQGNVWYFGEISKNFEDGDLVSLDGSWRAGVDGALPGIIMKADPQVGDVYRQEFFLGEAEDIGKVVRLDGSASVPAAQCNGNCLVTKDYTPLEPDVDERKFYKRGLGLILEIDRESGERVELIEVRQD